VQGATELTDEVQKRLERVDERLAGQLGRSMQLNARLVSRLHRYAKFLGPDSTVGSDLLKIANDEDPI